MDILARSATAQTALLNGSFAALRDALSASGKDEAAQPRAMARALIFSMLDSVSDLPQMQQRIMPQGDKLVDELARITDLTWPAQEGCPNEAAEVERKARIEQLAKHPDPAIRHQLLEFTARAGHLHQMAGLLSRDVFLQEVHGLSSVERFLYGERGPRSGLRFSNPHEAIVALSKPRLEPVLTGHPTYTNTVASMRVQRELANALVQWKDGKLGEAALSERFRQLATEPVIKLKDGAPVNFTPQEEVGTMLYFLGNLYEDLGEVYASYDRGLGQAYKNRYDPMQLNLGIRFHSWGSSGDKDGNNNITADTTLYAIARHKRDILQRYAADLAKLAESGPLPESLAYWRDTIDRTLAGVTELYAEIEQTLDDKKFLTADQFDHLSVTLRQTTASLDQTKFTEALGQAYGALPAGERRDSVLALRRRVNIFGFSFGQIEYRETAEVYEKIVGGLIHKYAEMTPEQRVTALDELLSKPSLLAERIANLRRQFPGVEGKSYTEDPHAIVYHTLRRMELARDFPDMISHQVLAECKGLSNLLESVVLQRAVTTHDHRRAKLHVVPLFEDGETLDASPQIMGDALRHWAYRTHLLELPKSIGGKLVQQVQIAHSDNARRLSLLGARAKIYDAHFKLRAAMESFSDTEFQFFEGGSQSDPGRNGVRAPSATVNEFGIWDFSKMMFQGGDLLNYFNLPRSSFRLFTRNLTNSAEHLYHGAKAQCTPQDKGVIDSLVELIDDYADMFKGKAFSKFLDKLRYKEIVEAGGATSRGAYRAVDDETVIPATKMRTIGFSDTIVHNGGSMALLGAGPLREELIRHLPQTKGDPALLTPFLLKSYYNGPKRSPLFCDAVDRLLHGLVRSDLNRLDRQSGGDALVPHFRDEFGAAYKVAIEAYTGQNAEELQHEGGQQLSKRNVVLNKVFPHVADIIRDQDRYLELVDQLSQTEQAEGTSGPARAVRRMLHNSRSTVLHGRITELDDPTYGKLKAADMGYLVGNGEQTAGVRRT